MKNTLELIQKTKAVLHTLFDYDMCDGSGMRLVEDLIKDLSEIEPDNDKPYLYFEGERYYFGEEYEFGINGRENHIGRLQKFDISKPFEFVSNDVYYNQIRKIDHTTKYKKLLLELKEQAEKDGVNLKELM